MNNKSWYVLEICIAFMLCIFAPLEMFFLNASEFWFSLSQLLPILLLVFVVFNLLIGGAIHFIQKSRNSNIFYSLFLSVLLFLYIQGNFVPRNYGVLDGEAIEWNAYSLYALISIILLTIIIIFCLFLIFKVKEKVFKLGKSICTVIILIQVITIVTLYIQNYSIIQNQKRDVIVSSEGMFSLSKKGNIIIFILDTFDSKYMQELLNNDDGEKYKEIFRDFTYYPDTLGAYPTTKGALPFILTGVWYENEQPYLDYIMDAYSNNRLYNLLESNGYSIGLYTDSRFVIPDYNTFLNVKTGKYIINNSFSFAKKVYKLVAFNYLPHQLKPFFLTTTDEFDNLKSISHNQKDLFSLDTLQFYSDLQSLGVSLTSDKKSFRLYHVDGVHPPYTFDDNLKSDKDKMYNEYHEAAGNIYILKDYIYKLKECNIYDDTTLIILADHGHLDMSQNPIFLIKNAGEQHPFMVSEKEISYEYLDDIFLALVSGKKVDETFIDLLHQETPNRRFLSYTWDDSWEQQYLPNMIEFIAKGNVSDPQNLMMTGRRYLANGNNYIYNLNENLSFGSAITANKYCVYGFAGNEEYFTWTDGKNAVMQFNITDNYEDLLLTLEYGTYLSSERVKIYANENEIADYIAQGEEVKEFFIPGQYIEDGILVLRFELPDAISPRERGESEDPRQVALCMRTLTLSSAQ